jgi:hypothetical protein
MEADRDMIEDVTTLGIRAVVLLRGVMVRKVDRATLEWGLSELRPGEALEKYFPRLVGKPEYVDLLNVLHLLYGLEGQLDFQIQEYGIDSLKDDLAEINFSLNQIGEKLELPELQQVM